MASPCKVESIIDNLSSVDHWNILKSEQGNDTRKLSLDSHTAEVMQYHFQADILAYCT